MGCVKVDKEVFTENFLNSFDYIFTDCDGVLWTGNEAIPGAPKVINAFRSMGKKIFFVTNNSTKSREEYVAKCQKLGFTSEISDIFPTSYAVASYLKSIKFQKKVYVFGSTGITRELEKEEIKYLPIGSDPLPPDWIQWVHHDFKPDPEVGAVVVGFDEHISYPKLVKCATYLGNPEVLFIATNTDEQFPADGNIIIPGTGVFVAALETVSGRKPIILGKPHKYIFEVARNMFPDINPSRSLMIGDRISTDIVFGKSNGMKTLLVLSGISNLEEAEKYKANPKEYEQFIPDYYTSSLGDLANLMNV